MSGFMQILDSSHVIDQIFKQRQESIERAKTVSKIDQNSEQRHNTPFRQESLPLTHLNPVSSVGVDIPKFQKHSSLQSNGPAFDKKQSLGANDSKSKPKVLYDKSGIFGSQAIVTQGSHLQETPTQLVKDCTLNQFYDRVNSQLDKAGHSIQIVMQQSPNNHFYRQKERDMAKLQGMGSLVKNWQIDSLAQSQLFAPPSENLTKKEKKQYLEGVRSTLN